MTAVRTLFSAVLAAGATLSLFVFMQFLVTSGSSERPRLEAIAGIRFGPVDIEDRIETRSRRKPEPPPPRNEPPPPPQMSLSRMEQQTRNLPRVDIPDLDVPLKGGQGMYVGSFHQVNLSAEGDIVPVVVIRPLYPREAALSGIEGWVRVEFTITETGNVKDPRVIEARPSRVFNREAIRAILKWKFKPRVVDGIAVERRATQVIDFTLDER